MDGGPYGDHLSCIPMGGKACHALLGLGVYDMSSGRDRMAKKDARYADVQNFWGDPTKAAAYAKKKLRWGAHYERDCRLCGCPLGFGKRHGGKVVPLDLSAPVYCVTGGKDPGEPDEVVLTQIAYADHYATCPKTPKGIDYGAESESVQLEPRPVSGDVLAAGDRPGPASESEKQDRGAPAVPRTRAGTSPVPDQSGQ